MNSLGIYFGPKLINIVEARGKKILNSLQILQTTVSAGELEEKVPEETKIIEIVALFKDELRRGKVEAKEATFCLSGKDLIIRTFEIPMLPREELNSAISFEAKKYLPFKIEDLIFGFQLKPDKTSRTNMVLFMGIRKDVLDRYLSIAGQLGLKISAIEYSAFSILRCLNLSRLNAKGVVGVLAVDPQAEDEASFTVLEDGFPLFSRDIGLEGGPGLEKLNTEIRVSLDYYRRKFPAKNIREIYLAAHKDYIPDLQTFIKDAGFLSHVIEINKYSDKLSSYSLGILKAYTTSLIKAVRSSLKVNLLAVKAKAKLAQEEAPLRELGLSSLLEGLEWDSRILLLGALLCASVFGFGAYRTQSLQKEIAGIARFYPSVETVNPADSYDKLAADEKDFKDKLNTLEGVIRKQLFLTKPLNIIPGVIPKGAWITNFDFNKGDKDKAALSLQGMVYLADSSEEIKTANVFLESLKKDPDFSAYFKEITIVSLDQNELGDLAVTSFSILCKTE